jgi:hypothetical protein
MAQHHKSPYEIRQNLLELAFSILHAQHAAAAAADGHEFARTAPTTEDVVKEASKLNEFVSLSSRQER